MDRSGAWVPICLVVEVIAVVWFFLLLFAKGMQGPNRFGTDPRNTSKAPKPSSAVRD